MVRPGGTEDGRVYGEAGARTLCPGILDTPCLPFNETNLELSGFLQLTIPSGEFFTVSGAEASCYTGEPWCNSDFAGVYFLSRDQSVKCRYFACKAICPTGACNQILGTDPLRGAVFYLEMEDINYSIFPADTTMALTISIHPITPNNDNTCGGSAFYYYSNVAQDSLSSFSFNLQLNFLSKALSADPCCDTNGTSLTLTSS